jgi:adenosylmethionine-8-amino-7-oxononanoate aminotransferase
VRESGLLRSALVTPDWNREYPRIVRAAGSLLYDSSGRAFVDGSGGASAATLLGHGNPEIVEVIRRQASDVALLPTHVFSSPVVEAYMRELVRFAPPNIRYAWTVSSGSEAVENAAKLALQYHGIAGEQKRVIVLGRTNSYHGGTVAALDFGGMETRKAPYRGLMLGQPRVPDAYCLRCPLGLHRSSCNLACADEIERAIEARPGRVAAVILEPVVGAALGAVPAPDGYLQRVRAITRAHGVLLLVDEVMTGFARTGARFAVEHDGIDADIIACGKGMSGGYFPLAGILVSARVGDALRSAGQPFLAGHTYACNPLGSAVGRKVIEIIERDGLVERAAALGARCLDGLRELESLSGVAAVRGRGLLLGIELSSTSSDLASLQATMLRDRLLDEGIVVYPGVADLGGVHRTHLKLAPPLTTPAHVLERMIDRVVAVTRATA